MKPDVSIVILTFNSLGLLRDCVTSLRASISETTYEIIVVDNGSSDGTANWLRAQGDIRSVFNVENRGVAPARNQGLALCEGRYLAILDVDTIVTPGAFDTLVRRMDESLEVGLGAPRLTDGEGNLQYTCRRYPTALTKIYRSLPFKWAEDRLNYELLTDWDHESSRYVDYVIGACQIFRRGAFERVGPLDEAVFYGPEDIDYCLRMWKHGWKVGYFPDAVIRHLEQRVTVMLFSRTAWKRIKGLAHFFLKYRYVLNSSKLPGCSSVENARAEIACK